MSSGGTIMDIKIQDIQRKDYKKAIQYAIKGMNFKAYIDNDFLLNLYGRYFWYLELCNATQVIAAYQGNELVGVLLADITGEEKKHGRLWNKIYVNIFNFLQNTFYNREVSHYDNANKKMLANYKKQHTTDGEIRFLAANPIIKGKGVGTLLLQELEKRERGKTIYLFTDTNCTYQFYEKRGFVRVGEKDIVLDMITHKTPLKCLLYSKKL